MNLSQVHKLNKEERCIGENSQSGNSNAPAGPVCTNVESRDS